MICVLCEPEDDDVLWLAAALQGRGEVIQFVLPEDLLIASALTCRIDSAAVTSSLRLRDGTAIDADGPKLVVNRWVELPTPAAGASPADAGYLAEEWRAAAVAWLRTMRCPVLNPPRAASLSGLRMPPPAWRAVARAHGVPIRPWRSDQEDEARDPCELVCLGARCIDPTGAAPPGLTASLVAMSRYTGTPLLGATFDRSDGQWELVDATSRPELARAGQALVDAVIAYAHGSGAP